MRSLKTKKILVLFLSLLISNCATSPKQTNYTTCILDYVKGSSKCSNATETKEMPNSLMDGFTCMPAIDWEGFSTDYIINKQRLKKLLGD